MEFVVWIQVWLSLTLKLDCINWIRRWCLIYVTLSSRSCPSVMPCLASACVQRSLGRPSCRLFVMKLSLPSVGVAPAAGASLVALMLSVCFRFQSVAVTDRWFAAPTFLRDQTTLLPTWVSASGNSSMASCLQATSVFSSWKTAFVYFRQRMVNVFPVTSHDQRVSFAPPSAWLCVVI